MMRVALQWQLHKACKATVDTSLDLKDVPAGKISKVPVGLSFDIAY
jgi:hypothetical protein